MSTVLPRTIAGRYALERELGRGGMGVVYLAREQGRAEPIALKLLHTRELSETALRHFEQEFRTLTTLAHPNLTDVYDFGRTTALDGGGEIPFFTMELVDGEPLDRDFQRSPRDFARLYRVLAQTGQALAYLHGQGLVHQDVKPSNILVAEPRPGELRVKLMDLGLAVRPREMGTTEYGIRGTAAYLSPEAARGGPVDPRSDLYSLGCVIYELVTGRPPFQGTSALSVLRGHLQEEALPPSTFNREVPPAFEELVLKLLSKDPGLRPASADRFLEQLNAVAGGTLEIETPEVRRHRVLGGGFVGRERELGRLAQLTREVRAGSGRLVLLVGEAGVGKSRLLREFQVRCQLEGFELYLGRSEEGRMAIVEALRKAVRARGPLGERTRNLHGTVLENLLGPGPGLWGTDTREPESSPAPEGHRLPEAVASALDELGGGRPFALALEDLHAADETTCRLVHALSRTLATASPRGRTPLLLLGTYRGDEVSRSSPFFDLLAEARREGAAIEEIFLDPLDPDTTASLLRARCGTAEIPPEFLRRILEETRGNPLHVGELLALLAEEGHLRPGTEAPFDPETLPSLELPGKIRDLLDRRLDRIPPEPTRALVAGAVLGGSALDPDAIAAVTGMRWEHVVRQLIDLMHAGLVQREEDEEGAPVYRILNPGLGSLVRERARPEDLRRLHAQVVSYLERRGVPRTHAAWSEFARHAEAAGQPGRAVEAYTRAGDLARELHASREAIGLYGRAIDLALRQASAPASVVCGLYEKRADVHAHAGDLQRAEEDCRWMLARAGKAHSDPLVARAHMALGGMLAVRGRYPEAEQNLQLGLGIAERLNDAGAAARARIGLGEVAAKLGRFAEGIRELERAREDARKAGQSEVELQALLAEGALHREQGDFRASLECFREAARRSGGRAAARLEEAIEEGMALALEVQGEPRKALEGHARARERARGRSDVRAVAALTSRLGALHLKLGDPLAARREIEEALELQRRLGLREAEVSDLQHLARLHGFRGRPAEALETAEDALSLARRVGQGELVATSLGLIGSIHLGMGDLERARRHLEEAHEILRDIRNPRWLAPLLVDLGDLGLLGRDPAKARGAYQESAFLARRIGDRRFESTAMCRLGEAHLTDNDFDRARVACNKALAIAAGSGFPREEADARLLRARIEVARPGGDLVSAEVDALEALRIYRAAHAPEGIWQAEHVASRAELRLGRHDEGVQRVERAHRYLQGVRSHLGEPWRQTFLVDPRRREVFDDWARLRGDLPEEPAHAVAVEEDGELAQARQQAAALRRLLEINRTLAMTRDTEGLLRLILDAALELTGAERGFLLLRDDGELTTREARAAGGESLRGEALAMSRSIARQAMERGEAMLSADVEGDERFSGFQSVHDLKIRSVLAVPLPIREELAGALYLDSRLGQRVFTPFHLELVSRLADQAALALGTARLVGQIEDQRSRLERLNQELEHTLAAQREELADAREELSRSRSSFELRHRFEDLIGASSSMQRVYHLIERLAPRKLPVLITGESGTGKELIARALHAKSDRAGGPFFTVNCAAVSETLLESELFGYRKGAFTGAERDKPGYFELAHGGTLFLDEIGEMSQLMQAKLLGAIERGEVMPVGGKSSVRVDVRIVSATHRDLQALIREGAFREDLYYRIHVGRIDVPPLRERPDDIPLLVDHFLTLLASEEGQPRKQIEPAALRRLVGQPWPGNVRELQHQILRISAFARGPIITLRDVERYGAAGGGPVAALRGGGLESLEELEIRQIRRALEQAGGNRTKAAEILGINRATLFRKLKRFQIE
jgi:transcriptional regulator with GAF, ATPase, and Fis domain